MIHKFKAYIEEEQRLIDVVHIDFMTKPNVSVWEYNDDYKVYTIPPEHLLPYIQRKDKNGDEIYVGHIIGHDGECFGYVRDINTWVWRESCLDKEKPIQIMENWDVVEIIGHALLNPELMEGNR